MFEHELAEFDMISVVKLTSYIAHSHKEAMDRRDGLALFQGWRVPCLGLTIIGKLNVSGSSDEFDMMYIIPGPYITFYAIVFLDQWRVVSITPTQSCLESAGDGDDQKALYAAFYSALDLLACIDDNPHTAQARTWRLQIPIYFEVAEV